MTQDFAELCAATHYSFLRGASSPSDMVAQAIALGMTGIGIADVNSVAGVVRAHVALRRAKEDAAEAGLTFPPFRLVVGARLVFADDTPDMIAYPLNRHGWGRLTRLLSTGNLRAEKGDCFLYEADVFENALEWTGNMALIVLPKSDLEERLLHRQENFLRKLRSHFPHLWIGTIMPHKGRDKRQFLHLQALAQAGNIPLLATNDPLYATPEKRPLHDILTCIAQKTTITKAGRLLAANAERHLKEPAEMARLFRDMPDAIAQTQTVLSHIDFTLDQLSYHYPDEPVPEGWSPQDWLAKLAWDAAHEQHGDTLPQALKDKVEDELRLIEKLEYAPYFLTVHDIVKYARSKGILCQGRGSAANSAVCFLLGVTSVDPMKHDLLFSRFISEERREPPDIDVDFEHERREEVIQYIYERYGRHRAGIAATVVHYRSRSAIREVGKALDLSEDITSRLSSTVWGSHSSKAPDDRFKETGLDPDNPHISRLGDLVREILQFPRHLSQHVGGFVLTQDRLDETVPIHHAAMADRTFIEWDKDDIDALGLMKVDILALGMLSCIRKAFDLMRRHSVGDYALVTVPQEDEATYDMLCKGDSIGVFQVESRAQINMLPRLRPREFYDLVVQVAIVRPGPIEGEMVHPYLRRRSGMEPVSLPSPHPPHNPDELKSVLGKTFGVPLFQEQAMRLAIVAANFSPADANKLRRAMATFRNVGTIHHFQQKMIDGMVARGYEQDFAERCYKQIQGFGSYGFPESHAQSFAILVYISSWIKCHHPAVFAAALLNSQPMGFYAPAQIVRDAREHGVEVRGVDVNFSDWDNSLEGVEGSKPGTSQDLALRIGLRQIDSFREEWANDIMANRPYDSIEQLARKAGLPARALRLLADADACRSLGLDRRQALWEVRRTPSGTLPLFEAANAREQADEPDARLPAMTKPEHVVTDYQSIRLSLKGHPMEFLRQTLHRRGISTCADLSRAKHGSFAKVAGVVLIRQRPGKGNAIFITLEDETGVSNLLLWASRFEKMRRPVMAARLMIASGEVQRSREGVTHLIVSQIEDATDMLDRIALNQPLFIDQPFFIEMSPADEIKRPIYRQEDRRAAREHEDTHKNGRNNAPEKKPMVKFTRHGHPRNVRILPKSRDFH